MDGAVLQRLHVDAWHAAEALGHPGGRHLAAGVGLGFEPCRSLQGRFAGRAVQEDACCAAWADSHPGSEGFDRTPIQGASTLPAVCGLAALVRSRKDGPVFFSTSEADNAPVAGTAWGAICVMSWGAVGYNM